MFACVYEYVAYESDSSNHVTEEGLEGGEWASLFPGAKPHLKVEVLTLLFSCVEFNETEFNGDVSEILSNFSSGALDGNYSLSDGDSNYNTPTS